MKYETLAHSKGQTNFDTGDLQNVSFHFFCLYSKENTIGLEFHNVIQTFNYRLRYVTRDQR